MRKSSRELVQKSNTVTMEKSPSSEKGCESLPEGESVGGGDLDRIKDRSSERRKSTGVNLESILTPQESSDKGKKTNVTRKELQEEETLHERGKVFCVDKQQESILPILRKESHEATIHQKVSGEEMQWEIVTAQREDLIFVFKERPEGVGDQNEANIGRPNKALGPMAMTHSNELGWTAEVLGPTSGHWKCKARAAQNSGLKENASLS